MMNSSSVPNAIIFFGPDRAGKTTQADLLANELRNRNFKVKKIWLRSLHTLHLLYQVSQCIQNPSNHAIYISNGQKIESLAKNSLLEIPPNKSPTLWNEESCSGEDKRFIRLRYCERGQKM